MVTDSSFSPQVMQGSEAKQYLHDARAMGDVMRPLDFEPVAR